MATRVPHHRTSVLGFLFDLAGRILVWFIKSITRALWRLIVIAVCHPRTSAALALGATLVLQFGALRIATVTGALLLLASTWKAAHRASFEATLGGWARTWWRRWYAYRRTWLAVCTRCDLAVVDGDETYVPKISKVTTTAYWDHILVTPQVGQALPNYQDAVERLRIAFGAKRAVAREISPSVFELAFMRRDPLLSVVPATPIPASLDAVDYRALPVGRDEYGEPYTMSVLGGHTSIAGATGAGKAGVGWNLLRALGPAIAAGLVRVVLVDPKGKELRQARPIAAPGDYVGAEPEAVLALLDRLVGEMNAANERDGANGERDFDVRPGRPLTLILVDELAPLLHYWPRSIRSKIEDALGLLLTQGRAAGFTVIGAIQEPTKDVFTIRDLFARRIAMRLPTESHTDAALVEDAVKYGAECHLIPVTEGVAEGVFFSLQAGARATLRARLGWVRNEHIKELVDYVMNARKVVDLDTRRAETVGQAAA